MGKVNEIGLGPYAIFSSRKHSTQEVEQLLDKLSKLRHFDIQDFAGA
ncbi:hypothetical protein [Bacillus sp. SD088]|nr:hypothetical protein [Bacillus sp. SD088]MBO0992763.1 hypothetical protein [Bacillus sp. SD088]